MASTKRFEYFIMFDTPQLLLMVSKLTMLDSDGFEELKKRSINKFQ